MDGVIFSLDHKGHFIYLSPAVKELISFDVKEMMGQPVARFVYQEDLPNFLKNLEHCLAGRLVSFEFRAFDKKGNIRHLRLSHCQLIKEGQSQGLTGILNDLTQKRLTETLLTQAKKKYHRNFENSVKGSFRRTFEGKFITVSPTCAQILGYTSPEELITCLADSKKPFYVDLDLK